MQTDPHLLLKRYWGYDRFRSPQKDIITSILNGKDTVALLPTGGGKSLCYQLPSLILPGKTVVVSPLISLMQDQVAELESRNISAKAIHTGMSYSQIEAILDNFVHGPLKILYVSPERILTEAFQVRFNMAKVSLIAVDEAHCISQWGHDFRPSYLNINMLREIKPEIPILALTATATNKILEDIKAELALNKPVVFRNSFARDNISFSSIRTENKTIEFEKLVGKLRGTGIIYTRSRIGCVKIANWLKKKKISAQHYHGGMTPLERENAQANWMKNGVQIMVATNAFGMGINKSDVRFVIHMDIPPSIEEYYQEAGRAGRDGKMSYAISIISNQDMLSAVKNFETYHPTLDEIKQIYISLCKYLKIAYDNGIDQEFYVDIAELSKTYKIPITKIYTTLKILEKQEWLVLSEGLRSPSQAMVVCNPREVNDMYNQDDPRYMVLSQLLRSYEGIFVEYVNIVESTISKAINLPINQITGYLKVLQNEAMIHYNPSSDLPKVTFLKSRPRDDSFKIDERSYKALKENSWNKLNAVINYHSLEKCRQQTILDYFDEGETFECGQCDYCLGSYETSYDENIKQEILSTIQNSIEGISPRNIIQLFPYNKRKRVYQCLEDLESEKMVRVDDRGNIRMAKPFNK